MKLLPAFKHLAKTPDRMLMTGEIVEATGSPYPTVISWITKQHHRLPATRVESPRGHYYTVKVSDLLAYEPLSPGRRSKADRMPPQLEPVSEAVGSSAKSGRPKAA